MQRVAMVSPSPGYPSGLPSIVERLVGEVLREGAEVRLISQKPTAGFPHLEVATETSQALSERLHVEWWPSEEFRVCQRSRLCYHFEQLVHQHRIDRILAVGVKKCGFAAVVAGRLVGVPVSVFVTHADAFSGPLQAPHELETVIESADHLFCTNPAVISFLGRFYDVAGQFVLLDSRACAIELAVSETFADTPRDEPGYVVTTGQLNSSVHLPELLRQVQRGLSREGVPAWKHVGIVQPDTLVPLMRLLTSLGMADDFSLTGILPRAEYAEVVCGAKALIVFDGERDTNLAAYEAEASGVQVTLPEDGPFPRYNEALEPGAASHFVDWGELTEILSA